MYIDGAFDLFHAGHVEALRLCRQLGDFVIVGIYEEDVVRRLNKAGPAIPLQTVRCGGVWSFDLLSVEFPFPLRRFNAYGTPCISCMSVSSLSCNADMLMTL